MSKLDSLIAGLTMLRAYNGTKDVRTEDAAVVVDWESSVELHPEDIARMNSEGWTWNKLLEQWSYPCG